MVLVANVAMLVVATLIGKRSGTLGWKQFVAIGFMTLLQTIVAGYYMYHLEKPPLF